MDQQVIITVEPNGASELHASVDLDNWAVGNILVGTLCRHLRAKLGMDEAAMLDIFKRAAAHYSAE